MAKAHDIKLALQALKQGDSKPLEILASNGFDVNAFDSNGKSALWYMGLDGRTELAFELMEKFGGNPAHALDGYLRMRSSRSPGDVEHFASGCKKMGLDLNDTLPLSKKLPLDLAAYFGAPKETLAELVSSGCRPDALSPGDGKPVFFKLLSRDDEDIDRFISQWGCDPCALSSDGSQSLMHEAINKSCWAFAQSMAARLPDETLASMSGRGKTPLILAICRRNEATALALAQRGLWIHDEDERGKSPLYWAVSCGMENLAKELLAKGADPNKRSGKNGMGKSPLRLALRDGNGKIRSLMASVFESRMIEEASLALLPAESPEGAVLGPRKGAAL